MKKNLLPLLITAALLAAFVDFFRSSADTKFSKEIAARIERVENGLLPGIVIKDQTKLVKLADRMKEMNVPGVSVAVINNGKIEWAKGYGVADAETKQPVTTETRFQAASISKPVAAMAMLRMVEQGKLSLDEDVNLKLKSWKVPDSEFTKEKKVTLRRIVSHSAGLTVSGFPGYAADKEVATAVQVLNGEKPANTAPIRVDSPLSSKWRYSGGGYTVMQLLMTDVTGKTFPALMHELVLKPIGMTRSTYEQPLPQAWAAQGATAHRMNGTPIKGRWHTYPEMAAAGLWTTPTDLALFALEVVKSKAGKSNKVLSQRMTNEMLAKQFENWGLGPELRAEGRAMNFGHSGGNAGFRCWMIAFPETGQGAVVMTNGDNGIGLVTMLLRSIAVEYNWPDWKPQERMLAKVNPKIFAAYVGKYEMDGGAVITISQEGDKLMVEAPGQPKAELLPASETKFFTMAGGGSDLSFKPNADGQVTELIVIAGRQELKARRLQ